MATFVMSKEYADKQAKRFINMKAAVALIETKLPGCSIEKMGKNQMFVTYKDDRIYFSKKSEVVVIKGRGGEAFRERALGFSAKGIAERIDSEIPKINKKVEAARVLHEKMEARRAALRIKRENEKK